MRRVYVAHPYGGKEENKVEVEKIIKSLVEEDVKKGENTLYVSPIHCTGFIYDYVSYEDGMDMCFELLEGCDEILICGKDWKKSTGVCMEYGFAKANGMRIVFHNNVVLTRQVFREGDRVRTIINTDCVHEGAEGVVLEVDGDDCMINWESGVYEYLTDSIWWVNAYDIVKENNEEKGEIAMKLRIKYFEGATKLEKITKGNWIDVYANKDVFVPVGERAMIPLGFALELPQGWEGHLAPRSSTFKTWGVIQTNSVGVVDDTYIGDNDQWHMPVYCLQGKDTCWIEHSNSEEDYLAKGTWIRKGDKIGQFRIMEVMPELEFEEVESFGNADRGGFGSTGTKK